MSVAYDVLGIGNAIVDVLAQAEDEFLDRHGLRKSEMALITAERAELLYADMAAAVEISGGSAANTIAGIAGLGGRGVYIGKVRDDQLGAIFAHDIRAAGVTFTTAMAQDGPPTARSMVLITPDAQRTMNTYLGACVELGPEDVDGDQVTAAAITYMEGYLWDPPRAKEAFRKAIALAHGAGRRTALSLSDMFCVERHRDEFLALLQGDIDIVFANEDEAKALFQTDSLDTAVAALRERVQLAAVTRSEKGSLLIDSTGTHEIPAAPVEQVVDTTGAGDLYAAGLLFGLTNGYALPDAGRIASLAAGEIIAHVGARPQQSLQALLAERGLVPEPV